MIIALMTGGNAMKIMCNGQKMIGSVQETLHLMITAAALKWTLLKFVFRGKD